MFRAKITPPHIAHKQSIFNSNSIQSIKTNTQSYIFYTGESSSSNFSMWFRRTEKKKTRQTQDHFYKLKLPNQKGAPTATRSNKHWFLLLTYFVIACTTLHSVRKADEKYLFKNSFDSGGLAYRVLDNSDNKFPKGSFGDLVHSKNSNVQGKTVEIEQQDLIVVLAMHRSGTSMITGIFVASDMYDGGTKLKPASEFNKKGYFEDGELVRQNIVLMKDQNVGEYRPTNYNASLAIERIKNGELNFTEGKNFLERSFSKKKEYPAYIVKDPRLCITLPTWLHFMKQKPSVLFTYRHPMEVVMSLYKRNHNLISRTGTNAWIEYNRQAIQASADLCVVYSNYDNLLNNTVFESDRIMREFHTKCGLSQTRTNMTQTHFVDHSLRHNLQHTDLVGQCEMDDYGQAIYEERGGMVAKYFDKRSFFIAMEIYCDMKSGVAFQSDYIWPDRHSVERKWNQVLKNLNSEGRGRVE